MFVRLSFSCCKFWIHKIRILLIHTYSQRNHSRRSEVGGRRSVSGSWRWNNSVWCARLWSDWPDEWRPKVVDPVQLNKIKGNLNIWTSKLHLNYIICQKICVSSKQIKNTPPKKSYADYPPPPVSIHQHVYVTQIAHAPGVGGVGVPRWK